MTMGSTGKYAAARKPLTRDIEEALVNAIAPILFAFVIENVSPAAALWVAAVSAVTGFVAVFFLVSFCKANLRAETGAGS